MFTVESAAQIEETITWYTDETSACKIDYNNRYFTHGVE